MDARSAACGGTEGATLAGVAPLLVIGIGNPSRGDDALGPACIDAMRQGLPPGVELLTDFQLQIEHVLDLDGRERVVFVDASLVADAPYELAPVEAGGQAPQFSHALGPAQLLDVYRRVQRRTPPPAQVLAIRGYHFELGEPLSLQARANLDEAARRLRELIAPRRPAGA